MIKEKQKMLFNYKHLDHAPVIVLVLSGSDFKLEYLNRRARSWFNIQGEKVTGLQETFSQELFAPELLAEMREVLFEKKQPFDKKELQVIRHDGAEREVRWVTIHCDLAPPVDGDIESVIVFLTDVTETVIAREPIGFRDKNFTNFFKHAPVAIVCYRGEEFIVDLANEKALQMWGKKIDEVQGRRIDDIFPEVKTNPVIKARHALSVEKLKKGEAHIEKEVELPFLRDGKLHKGWFNYIHEPYYGASGQTVGMMAITIEVTEQVMARKKLQLITDALPSLVSYVNKDEEYEFVNKAYTTWFQKHESEVVGRTVKEVLGEPAYNKIRSHINSVLNGKFDSFEQWLDYKDGGRRFISASYVPHLDDQQNVCGYVGLINDLTIRKQQEEALRQSEERMRLVVEGIEMGAFEFDLQSQKLTWSPQLKKLVGFAPELEVDAALAKSVVHPEDLSKVLSQAKGLTASTGDLLSIDYRIIRSDTGDVRWLHSRSTVMYHEVNGLQVPSKIIGFTIDITDRKLSERRLEEFNRALEHQVEERTSDLREANRLLRERNDELQKTYSILQQLIDSSVEYIAVIDKDRNFVLVNKAFETFVNKTREQLLGKNIKCLYDETQDNGLGATLNRAFAGETIHIETNPSLVNSGTWLDTYYVPLLLKGSVEGIIALSRNITDIVTSRRALEKLNNQLAEAQRLAKLGSWEWHVAAGTVRWSDEMYNIYGYNDRFPVNFAKATERMSPEHVKRSNERTQEHIKNAMEAFLATGQQVYEIPSVEYPIEIPGAPKKLLRNTGKIELTSEGKLDKILGVIQDVTEIRQTEEKLHSVVKELEEKNSELESFNYIASHDLQEPLRKIRMFIDRIQHSLENGKLERDYLSKIDVSANRMTELLQAMLTLSRVTKQDTHVTDVDLNHVLETCKADLDILIKEKNAIIKSDILPVISGNEVQLAQVFGNLISNSLKFCEQNPFVQINVEKINGKYGRSESNEYWCITFKDNGIGFDPAFGERIFELFQRLHPKQHYEGSGIGLNIVKRIVQKHGGSIEAASQPGHGATFRIFFPVL